MVTIRLPAGRVAWSRAALDQAWADARAAELAAASRNVIGTLTVRGGLMTTTALHGGVLT